MITKVVYFVETPFNARDYDRFGVETLSENGFEVEVWEFTPFLHPESYGRISVPDPVNYGKHYLFLSKRHALKSIVKLKNNCFVVCIISYFFRSLPIYRTLSKNKVKYGVFMSSTLPPIAGVRNIRGLFNKLKKITPQKLFKALYNRVPFKFIGIKPPTIILAVGEKAINSNYPIDNDTEILWLHTLDYDVYLKEKDISTQADPKIGIFIDEYLPFHPDYTHHGLRPFSTPEKYYPLLCRLFDFLEEEYSLDIVIAADPRSRYEDHPDYFGGRQVIRGRTAELIRKAGFVIMHGSTAINFAVLFKKPLIFVTTNDLKQSGEGPMINAMASAFRKKVINLENTMEIDLEKELVINEEDYCDYRNLYIKKDGTDELPFWQIVANRLKVMEN
jgi:hypothetical protein